MKIYIKTYGCTANQDNEAIIKGVLTKNKHKFTNIKDSDIIIINTCIVKQPTESKVINKIKEIQQKYPSKRLVIAGCMPEAEYNLCKKLAPDSSLINTHHITNILDVIKSKTIIELLGKRKEIKLNLPKTTKDKIVAVQIAEGCISNCSFCITKLAKGNLNSFPEKEITKEIRQRIKEGCKRINLTATDLACYGRDINTNLVNLLNKIIRLKGNFKIRLGMMNPSYITKFLPDLIEIYKDQKIIPFLHIPVQSGSDKILKDMNRNYTAKQFKRIINEFRKNIPKIYISTDIIAGYPTETEKDFKETIRLIKEIKPNKINISKFLPRPNTKASNLKQLPIQTIKKRSKELTLLSITLPN